MSNNQNDIFYESQKEAQEEIDFKPTEKQINKIVYEVEAGSWYNETLKEFWEAQPLHDWKHNDLKADYRRAIFEETLEANIKTIKEASTLIKILLAGDYQTFIDTFNSFKK